MIKKEISRKDFTKNRDTYIVDLCTNKNVLHIGACDAPYTKQKFENNQLLFKHIDSVASEQLGIDIDLESIEIMKTLGFNNIIHMDMNSSKNINFDPDIIILGETIEHIMNLENAFHSLKEMMKEDTKLVISTPNFITFSKILHAISGKEWQHPDHNLVMTHKTLEQLIQKVGLKVETKKFTFLPNHLVNVGSFRKLDYIIAQYFPIFSSTLLFTVKK